MIFSGFWFLNLVSRIMKKHIFLTCVILCNLKCNNNLNNNMNKNEFAKVKYDERDKNVKRKDKLPEISKQKEKISGILKNDENKSNDENELDDEKANIIGFTNNQIILERNALKNTHIDIKEKTILIGFNEPKFKKSKKSLSAGDMDAKLNARLVTYFMPAVEIARQQKNKPRLVIVSALPIALRWNAQNEEQKKIMTASNAIKMDFLKTFFEEFFPDVFSLIEYVVSQDVLKVSEKKLLDIWKIIEKKNPEKIKETKFQLTKFMFPKQFNARTFSDLSFDKKKKLDEVDATPAFKYAIAHLFIFGDVNFEGNNIHNPRGYVSIGGESELFFNIIRDFAYEVLKDFGEFLFDRKLEIFNNYRIILKNKHRVPPPHNGVFRKKNYLEVTYENDEKLDFYKTQEKVREQMEYMYNNLLPEDKYQKFWSDYKSRYTKLKERYNMAYKIKLKW